MPTRLDFYLETMNNSNTIFQTLTVSTPSRKVGNLSHSSRVYLFIKLKNVPDSCVVCGGQNGGCIGQLQASYS